VARQVRPVARRVRLGVAVAQPVTPLNLAAVD
jgi:hypothetical protein